MKILHIIPSFAPIYGGPIHALAGLAREQIRQGHEVAIMTTNISDAGSLDVPLDRPVDMDGAKVYYFAVEYPRKWCFSRPLSNALRQRVRHFDLVHIHSIFLWPTSIGAFWCRRYGIPYIIRPAGSLDPVSLSKPYASPWISLISRIKKTIYLNTLGRWDLGRASAIHFTSQDEMDSARPLNLKPPALSTPLGVGEDAFYRDATDAHPLDLKDKKTVLFLSRLDPVKGLDILLPAISRLARQRNDFMLLIAGKGEPSYEAGLRAWVEKEALAKHVNFMGFAYGMPKRRLFSEADIFVLPSYHENFGMVVVEAMAAGLPVVISNRVNIGREIASAGAGLVVEPDPSEICRALDKLLSNDDLRREMGRKASLLATQRFTWRKAGEEITRMYGRVMRGFKDEPVIQGF